MVKLSASKELMELSNLGQAQGKPRPIVRYFSQDKAMLCRVTFAEYLLALCLCEALIWWCDKKGCVSWH